MTLHEERRQILEMVASGKITPEEGVRLLEALEGTQEGPPTSNRKPRWFKVRVTDLSSGKPRVDITLPLTLVKFGLRVGGRFRFFNRPNFDESMMKELENALLSGETGKIVDIMDAEGEERVEVYVE